MAIKTLSFVLGLLLCAGIAAAQSSPQSSDQSQPQPGDAPSAQSQPPMQHRAPDPVRQARHLGKKLGLSPDQVSQLTPILADRQQQLEQVRSDSTLAPRDRRAKVRDIMQDSKGKIEAVLTDAQKQQYEQMLEQQRERRQELRQSQSQPQAPSQS